MFSSNTTDFTNIITNGLIYQLDAAIPSSYSGSGTTWVNLRDSTKNATLVNSPTYSTTNGGRLLFNGTNQYAISDMPTEFSSNFMAADSTISIWINHVAIPGSGSIFRRALAVERSTTNGLNIMQTTNANQIQVGIKVNGTVYTRMHTLSTNAWFNLVAVFVNSPLSLKYYVNAIERTAAGNFSSGSFYATNKVVIGGRTDFNTSAFTNCYVQEVLMYNRALSPIEILQNYNARRWRYGNY